MIDEYRVTHLLADWVGLTWIWDVPLFCLGSTAAAVQPIAQRPVEHPKSKSTQPTSVRRWDDGSPCRVFKTKTNKKEMSFKNLQRQCI